MRACFAVPPAESPSTMNGGELGLLRYLVESGPVAAGIHEFFESFHHYLFDDGLHLGVAELGLGLALKLDVVHLNGEHGGEALLYVVDDEWRVLGL